jgi:hypothetical protein
MLRATPSFSLFKLARALLPIALAVSVGSALLGYQAVSTVSTSAGVAGEAKMQMLRDEHTLIADYLASDTQARKLADAAADRDIARMRLAAQGEIQRQAHIAAAEQAKQAPAPEFKTVALRTQERVPSARAVGRDVAVAEPLQLAQAAAPQVVQLHQTRAADGPVRSRLRELASDVRRIPSLLQSAAGWIVDAVPAPKLPSLPGLPIRQFSAAI